MEADLMQLYFDVVQQNNESSPGAFESCTSYPSARLQSVGAFDSVVQNGTGARLRWVIWCRLYL